MADNEQDRGNAGESDATDTFDQDFDKLFPVSDSEEADEAEADESEAGDTPETTAVAEEDKAPPPTAEELGVDTSTPEGKAQFKALLAKWNKWQDRFNAKQKQKPEPAKVETPAQTPAQAAEATALNDWDPYTIPLDKFVYDGGNESEDSVLSGAEKDIDRRIQKGVAEGIKFALDAMRQNDSRLREMAQVGTAQQQISAYAEALQAHPEWDEKAAEVAEFAENTKELAVKNPEKWIRAVEGLTGIHRNWRTEDAPAAKPNLRITKKPLSNVSRPTNGNRATAPAGSEDMAFNDAFEHNWKRMQRQ